jgi:hypothetical protein
LAFKMTNPYTNKIILNKRNIKNIN